MAAIFRPAANLASKVALLIVAAVVLIGAAFWWLWPRTDYARHVRSVVEQPVPFSHQHHVAGLGIDCRFCHSAVEVSSNAGLPPTHTCMTCHSQIWTNASLLAPVRNSLANQTPITWRRVTDLPDYVQCGTRHSDDLDALHSRIRHARPAMRAQRALCRYQHFVTIHFSSRLGHPLASPL